MVRQRTIRYLDLGDVGPVMSSAAADLGLSASKAAATDLSYGLERTLYMRRRP